MAHLKKRATAKPDPNAATRDAILRGMLSGLTFGAACHVAGTSRRTGYRMRERDATFNAACVAARSVLELKMLDTIRAASSKHWTAAAWLLERVCGDKYKMGYKVPTAPTVIRFEGDPDAGLPKIHPMRAAAAN